MNALISALLKAPLPQGGIKPANPTPNKRAAPDRSQRQRSGTGEKMPKAAGLCLRQAVASGPADGDVNERPLADACARCFDVARSGAAKNACAPGL
jgi:hypothetical protein